MMIKNKFINITWKVLSRYFFEIPNDIWLKLHKEDLLFGRYRSKGLPNLNRFDWMIEAPPILRRVLSQFDIGRLKVSDVKEIQSLYRNQRSNVW